MAAHVFFGCRDLMARFFRDLMMRLLCLYAAMDDLLMATPPRQKSSQVE